MILGKENLVQPDVPAFTTPYVVSILGTSAFQ